MPHDNNGRLLAHQIQLTAQQAGQDARQHPGSAKDEPHWKGRRCGQHLNTMVFAASGGNLIAPVRPSSTLPRTQESSQETRSYAQAAAAATGTASNGTPNRTLGQVKERRRQQEVAKHRTHQPKGNQRTAGFSSASDKATRIDCLRSQQGWL